MRFAPLSSRGLGTSLLWPVLTLALLAAPPSLAQEDTITTAASIEQDQVNTYSVDQILQSGRQFFANDYLLTDGLGEGFNGPRSLQRNELWRGANIGNDYPFLRLNGLDSRSCFACHNSSGTYVPPGGLQRTRKPGGVGGAADVASALFLNPMLPESPPVGEPEYVTTGRITYILRTPPRAFGSAYVQELALEMSEELLTIAEDTRDAAAAQPNVPVTNPLTTKGVDYGSITVTCPTVGACTETIEAEGIADDLIVRPFQAKGVASTLRSFVKTALDFHHSVQAVEVVGINNDCDLDGKINEMGVDIFTPAINPSSTQVQQSLGNVLALSAFTGMVRPPRQEGSAPEGKALFEQIGCADCHVESLTTRPEPQFRIELGTPAEGCPSPGASSQLGSFAEVRSARHPAVFAADETREARENETLTAGFCPAGFYCIDLTNPGSLPGDFYPRIPANPDGSVTVNLYSDLKRHDLGEELAQADPPQADDAGNPIPNREWLTQKLWGVKDNGPWMHDGRARDLRSAVIRHAGRTGNDTTSEAHPVVQSFLSLSLADQYEIVEFLETLVIPLPQ